MSRNIKQIIYFFLILMVGVSPVTNAMEPKSPIYETEFWASYEVRSFLDQGIANLKTGGVSQRNFFTEFLLNIYQVGIQGSYRYSPKDFTDNLGNSFERINQEFMGGVGYIWDVWPEKLAILPNLTYLYTNIGNQGIQNATPDLYLHQPLSYGGVGINLDAGYRILEPLMLRGHLAFYPVLPVSIPQTGIFPESLNLFEIGGRLSYDLTHWLALQVGMQTRVFTGLSASPTYSRHEYRIELGLLFRPVSLWESSTRSSVQDIKPLFSDIILVEPPPKAQ